VSTLALVLTAFGLAVDCTAVAATRGVAARRVRVQDALVAGLWFGGFQGGLLVAGALLGAAVGRFIEAWDHWVAFALLVAVGLRALWEAREGHDERGAEGDDQAFRWAVMLPLAVATSLDAFAVGVTLPLVGAPIGRAGVVVALVSFALSFVGVLAGRRLAAALGRGLHVAGGLVLIGLGVKILVEGLRS
jgi:putative Mn2+ efflux pump MntP